MRPLSDLKICLRLFSRLPIADERGRRRDLAHAVTMVPVAGLIVGLGPAVVLVAGIEAGLPPLLASAFAITALVALTGALHEDGLADCADGFGGGRDVARKLEIMRDSRIGTFGTCAVVLSLLCRVAALGAIADRSALLGAAALVVAAILSRTACLLPLLLLPSARPEGLGASAGRPRTPGYLASMSIAFVLSLAVGPLGFGVLRIMLAFVIAFAGAGFVCRLAQRQIRGQSGDVAGAAQQIAEILALAVLASAA